MIQYKGLTGKLTNQFLYRSEVMRKNEDIIGKSIFLQQSNAAEKGRLQHKGRIFSLQYMTESFDDGDGLIKFEITQLCFSGS